MQAVIGSVTALVLLITTAQQLNDSQMTSTLTDLVKNDQAAALDLTVESARRLLRYTIMAMSVLSVTSLVLGFYVLRRHRSARTVLTVIGGFVAVLGLLAFPVGWIVTLYIGVSILLIWSRPARVWFSNGTAPGGSSGPGGSEGVGGPGGPGWTGWTGWVRGAGHASGLRSTGGSAARRRRRAAASR